MTPARHILFINEFFHPDICASAAVAADRLPRIARLRPDVHITVIAGNRAWDDPSIVYPAEEAYRGVRIVRVNRPVVSRTSLIRRALGFAAFQRCAMAAARGMDRIDLVIATTAPPQGAQIARKIADERGCPFVYAVLDLYPDLAATLGRLRPGGCVYRRWLARDTQAMRQAAAVVSVSHRITQRIAHTRRVSAKTLHTIHDGFDPTGVEPGASNEFKSTYNPRGAFVVQYAGNMGLSHPFGTLLAGANALAGDADILFQFIGDGPQRPFLQQHLPPNAQLIDYQPAGRLGQVLATADVCLISQDDGMFDKSLPYKIYAILAAGKPCVFLGNRQSEIADWLAQSGAGLHVDQGDTEAFIDAIRSFKADPSRMSAAGEKARPLFDDRFHADRAARQWVELIGRVLGVP